MPKKAAAPVKAITMATTIHGPDTARRYAIKGGLRSSELLLLQRAISHYAKFYQELKGIAVTQHEKMENQMYIDAADKVSRRLRHELEELK